jgi:hypothetical protein
MKPKIKLKYQYRRIITISSNPQTNVLPMMMTANLLGGEFHRIVVGETTLSVMR